MNDATTAPEISIIVPVWNGADRIRACLDAIERQTVPRDRFEVIVVDNGSTDDTAQIVREFADVTLLSEPLPGSYRARNTGLAVARSNYTLFTDGDCVPDPDWVAAALAAIASKPDIGLFGGRVALFREAGAGALCSRYDELVAFNQKVNIERGICVTANWLCPRHVLVKVGGFDQALLSGGDVECARRIGTAGYALSYVDDMMVRHPTRASLGAMIAKRRRVIGGRWQSRQPGRGDLQAWMRTLTIEAIDQVRWTRRAKMESWAKPGVAALISILLGVSLAELLRLGAGGKPFRS